MAYRPRSRTRSARSYSSRRSGVRRYATRPRTRRGSAPRRTRRSGYSRGPQTLKIVVEQAQTTTDPFNQKVSTDIGKARF